MQFASPLARSTLSKIMPAQTLNPKHAALEGQDLTHTYLAYSELESVLLLTLFKNQFPEQACCFHTFLLTTIW